MREKKIPKGPDGDTYPSAAQLAAKIIEVADAVRERVARGERVIHRGDASGRFAEQRRRV